MRLTILVQVNINIRILISNYIYKFKNCKHFATEDCVEKDFFSNRNKTNFNFI